jgi:ribosomal protein S15
MPPRIPLFQCLRAQAPPTPSRSFTSSATCQASTKTPRRRGHDPYAIAQAKARKAANLSRREVLRKERAAALGDAVRGNPTPFVQSFDNPLAQQASGKRDEPLNYFLTKSELETGIEHSKWLATPPPSHLDAPSIDLRDDETPASRRKRLAEQQATASEALKRIASLNLGSSKDRLRVNVRRCIDTFGRHNTDETLPPKSEALNSRQTRTQRYTDENGNEVEYSPRRAGPDTGSSEVQIAILTAKIKTLADFLETRGTTDKVNKRNLRLLVHKRQKLLQYLERKERGGPRWQRCIETLGLTPGTWKGEISL